MIADYSSYLELLAAVYISMLLDVETLNKLWYPANYYTKIQDALKKELPEEEGKLNDKIVKASKTNAAIRNQRMRCRAAFMLFFTAILLVLLGFESSFDKNSSMQYEGWYNAVAISYFVVVLICFFVGKAFDGWNTTALISLFVLFTFVVLMLLEISLPFSSNVIDCYPIVVVCLVTLPVLFEIFSRWVFSSLYSGYLRSYVLKVKGDYEKAIDALRTNSKNHMPRKYRKLINESIYTADSDKTLSDICIQGYVDIRNKKLNEISQYPNGIKILISWIGYSFYRLFHWLGKLFKGKEPEPVPKLAGLYTSPATNNTGEVVVLNYQKEYDQYMVERAKMNGKLNVRQFCQSHGYDSNAMIAWLKQRKSNN